MESGCRQALLRSSRVTQHTQFITGSEGAHMHDEVRLFPDVVVLHNQLLRLRPYQVARWQLSWKQQLVRASKSLHSCSDCVEGEWTKDAPAYQPRCERYVPKCKEDGYLYYLVYKYEGRIGDCPPCPVNGGQVSSIEGRALRPF